MGSRALRNWSEARPSWDGIKGGKLNRLAEHPIARYFAEGQRVQITSERVDGLVAFILMTITAELDGKPSPSLGVAWSRTRSRYFLETQIKMGET